MGGQETLLLVGRHPQLLAGAVAFDSVTDFFRRYADFAELGRKGTMLQALARIEVGGTPASNPRAYHLRSPQHWLDEIARSGVPLQVWWSDADEIVTGQENQSGRFFRELRELEPRASAREGHRLVEPHRRELSAPTASGSRALARPRSRRLT